MERTDAVILGNSRGVRTPAEALHRYHIGDDVIMEERSDGILLRPRGAATPKLSWQDTARKMAAATEDWSAWDAAPADGLLAWGTPAGQLCRR